MSEELWNKIKLLLLGYMKYLLILQELGEIIYYKNLDGGLDSILAQLLKNEELTGKIHEFLYHKLFERKFGF